MMTILKKVIHKTIKGEPNQAVNLTPRTSAA
jgi:hypothetical protein